jgi:hypothetical protein
MRFISRLQNRFCRPRQAHHLRGHGRVKRLQGAIIKCPFV